MSFFSDSAVEQLASGEVAELCSLFKVELQSGDIFACERAAPFTDTNGQTWKSVTDGIIGFDDLSYSSGAIASKRTYQIVAWDERLAFGLIGQDTEYRGRKLTQYLQFFSDGNPVGEPVVQHVGIMDRLRLSMSPEGVAILNLDCESRFAIKNSSVLSYYTHGDQISRYPDDDGLERVKILSLGLSVKWPDF